MSETTLTHTPGNYSHDPNYAAGRADAYDDSHALSLDELLTRANAYIDHAPMQRALGYLDRVAEIRQELAPIVIAAETELAWADLKRARR